MQNQTKIKGNLLKDILRTPSNLVNVSAFGAPEFSDLMNVSAFGASALSNLMTVSALGARPPLEIDECFSFLAHVPPRI